MADGVYDMRNASCDSGGKIFSHVRCKRRSDDVMGGMGKAQRGSLLVRRTHGCCRGKPACAGQA